MEAPDPPDQIVIVGASEHNLKDVDLALPRNALTVFTGVSGSGKSSLAFDTIFKEGQRRFVESLSPYARQFLGQMDKPKVESIEGLSPTLLIDQKTAGRNPRSTLGTMTEIYDHLRLLFARLGTCHCPECGEVVKGQTVEAIVEGFKGSIEAADTHSDEGGSITVTWSRDANQPEGARYIVEVATAADGLFHRAAEVPLIGALLCLSVAFFVSITIAFASLVLAI